MESEKGDNETGKKLWSIVTIAFLMLKRAKMASKAAKANLMFNVNRGRRHYYALTCRSDDIHSSFVTPCRHYEFSCSNTPRHQNRKENRLLRHEELNIAQRVFAAMDKCSSPREHGHQVDKDAEEFINKFYKDLMDQKRIAALESPSPYHTSARR